MSKNHTRDLCHYRSLPGVERGFPVQPPSIRGGRWPRPAARRPRVSCAHPGLWCCRNDVAGSGDNISVRPPGESRRFRLRHLCASGANPTVLRVRRRAHANCGSQADRVAIEKCPQRNRLTAAAWPPEICPSSFSSNSRDIGEADCEVLCYRNETTPGHQGSPHLDRPWLDGGYLFQSAGCWIRVTVCFESCISRLR